MLPKNVDTSRGRYLQAILSKVTQEEFSAWPMLKADDYLKIGGIVVLFSYIEFYLRRLVEGYDDAGQLQGKWQGKASQMRIGDVEKAALTLLPWPEENLFAFKRMAYLRSLRNLVAHFAVRRFPNDDAFVFIAKSAKDFEREFGTVPPPGAMLTLVMDGSTLSDALKEIQDLSNWLAKLTAQLEEQFDRIPRPEVIPKQA
jgi:hypothetical protein